MSVIGARTAALEHEYACNELRWVAILPIFTERMDYFRFYSVPNEESMEPTHANSVAPAYQANVHGTQSNLVKLLSTNLRNISGYSNSLILSMVGVHAPNCKRCEEYTSFTY